MAWKLNNTEAKSFIKLVNDLENAKEALRAFIDEAYTERDEKFEERSERWKETDPGSDAQVIVNSMQSYRGDIENIEIPAHDEFCDLEQ